MSRTSDITSSLIAARETVMNGKADFTVLVSQRDAGRQTTLFIIAVPFAVMRSGLFGRTPEAMLGFSGKPTRFGSYIFNALSAIDGVEPGLTNDTPHIVTVYINDSAMLEESIAGFHNQSRGLPASVCVAVQASIRRNRGLIQRFAEYLRRLF